MLTPEWLWYGTSRGASLARLALSPAALGFRLGVLARVAAYSHGILRVRSLPLPSIAVGNINVGGSGKTPIANYLAQILVKWDLAPAILLRNYRGDEAELHRLLSPQVTVVADPDRLRGAFTAWEQGADVLVLDDAFQRLNLRVDLNIALVAAESMRSSSWVLPAGPWREGLRALGRADLIVVTRRSEKSSNAASIAESLATQAHRPTAVVHLYISSFSPLASQEGMPPTAVAGKRILAVAGVARPDLCAEQLMALGARVTLLPLPDHYCYSRSSVENIVHKSAGVDYVVVTAKDAVKLRDYWPTGVPDPLVANLGVRWEAGKQLLLAMMRTRIKSLVTSRGADQGRT